MVRFGKNSVTSTIAVASLLVGLLAGCSGSGAGSRANHGGGMGGSDGADADGSTSGGEGESAGGGTDTGLGCEATCADDDPCTEDRCDGEACTHVPILNNACRPRIDVEFPPRAATVLGTAGNPTVEVTGAVHSGLGDITSLKINGDDVAVAPDGSFRQVVPATVGGNLLIVETEDSAGNARRRVQSFLWSTEFREPVAPPEDLVDEGLGFWLGQVSLDDGDHSMPANDLATILQVALGSFDINGFADPENAIASRAGYDIYLTALRMGQNTVGLRAVDGGLGITAVLNDIEGDLEFDCTSFACRLAGGDSSGGLSVDRVQVNGVLVLGVDENHQLSATLTNVDAIVDPDDVEIWSNNGWTDFLLSVVELFIHDSLVADLEGGLEREIANNLGPLLASGISDLSLSTQFDFPNLASSKKSIPVDLFADFNFTSFSDGVAPPDPSLPQGGAVVLRAGGYPSMSVTPYDNDGVPGRVGCGSGPQAMSAPLSAPLEIGLSDDTLNQLLFSGWRGGLLEFPLNPSGGGLVEDLQVDVSGMLAPTVSDCGPSGQLLATLGDIRIDASFTLGGNPVEFSAFTTLVVEMGLSAADTEVSLDLSRVVLTETELTSDDANIGQESFFIGLLESQLIDGLLGELGSSGFARIGLPDIDLSARLGLPPGSARLQIHADTVVRSEGNSVIQGHF